MTPEDFVTAIDLLRNAECELDMAAEVLRDEGAPYSAENKEKCAGRISRFLKALCQCGPLSIAPRCPVHGKNWSEHCGQTCKGNVPIYEEVMDEIGGRKCDECQDSKEVMLLDDLCDLLKVLIPAEPGWPDNLQCIRAFQKKWRQTLEEEEAKDKVWREEISCILWILANACPPGPSANEAWSRVQELRNRFAS